MHEFTPEVEALAKEILDYSLIRLRTDPPLDGPKTAQESRGLGDVYKRQSFMQR